MIELHIILILMIIAAIVAVQIKDLLSSVIALGAVGFGLTLEFLLLKAPDLAITQLVVEILSLIILIKATLKVGFKFETKNLPLKIIFGTLFVLIFLWFSYKAILELPKFGFPVTNTTVFYLTEALNKIKAANVVSSIILDFRSYDTLGEATVLFTGVIAVLTVLINTKKENGKQN
ncbi:MAG: DUF4040 domain-containing protein [Candidatus Omnitrophica bacterium]|nr:DUF4040 domain-containing protein [Candidatus Omnitrophota bacterium]MCM8830877.1 DUF4040 domain-containing protein [Candidatus Omnitrophota bacterium]